MTKVENKLERLKSSRDELFKLLQNMGDLAGAYADLKRQANQPSDKFLSLHRAGLTTTIQAAQRLIDAIHELEQEIVDSASSPTGGQ